MTPYEQALANLGSAPKRWLVTGAAGFIGSHLAEALLAANQTVVGLDNFATGRPATVKALSAASGQRFTFIEGDIRSVETCHRACHGVDYVLHQAAQVSVPASIQDPVATHETNVTGFLHMLLAARDEGVRRLVYASSCAVYGDSTRLPLTEDQPARPLSPYAASKLANEVYADTFSRVYGLESIGLRYFNVFGPRQDPKGPYAAVIPLWATSMLRHEPIEIFGDGSTTRDFCYIANVVQANLLAATADMASSRHEVVNVAVGGRTSLKDLFAILRSRLLPEDDSRAQAGQAGQPVHRDFRPGDVRHSQADITKARRLLGYVPTHVVEAGLQEALAWYRSSTTRTGF